MLSRRFDTRRYADDFRCYADTLPFIAATLSTARPAQRR